MTLLSLKEVAAELGIHRATVSRMIKSGALSFIAVGKRKMVPQSSVNGLFSKKPTKTYLK